MCSAGGVQAENPDLLCNGLDILRTSMLSPVQQNGPYIRLGGRERLLHNLSLQLEPSAGRPTPRYGFQCPLPRAQSALLADRRLLTFSWRKLANTPDMESNFHPF